MIKVKRSMTFNTDDKEAKQRKLINDEWLVTNGLGGYASASLCGATTRKYHGLLVAALPAPLGRTIMLNYIEDTLHFNDGLEIPLSRQETIHKNMVHTPTLDALKEFRLEDGLPIWTYEAGEIKLEKKIFMTHKQNTVYVSYELLKGKSPVELTIRPFFAMRHHEAAVSSPFLESCQFIINDHLYELSIPSLPTVRIMSSKNAIYTSAPEELNEVFFRIEAERGYDSVGDLKSPGRFSIQLKPGERFFFIASTENWTMIHALNPENALAAEKERKNFLVMDAERRHPQLANSSYASELVLAADQFIIVPFSRLSDLAWTSAIGKDARTVIAGYHWFTDWGRDTMISLEGLTLSTGRFEDAACILRLFAHHVREGLIPNMFPDGKNLGLYHTADATLWFFHALDRYLTYTSNIAFVQFLLPTLKEIIYAHIHGTHFGIRVADDGLLTQGQEGYALTWMDAKVDNLVVTPRRGKAVEINALWYNALRLIIDWIQKYDKIDEAESLLQLAEKCFTSFNNKFWNPEAQYLFDIIDGENGNDLSCRPNQVLSFSLKYPVLKEEYWQPVVECVKDKLLTPFGLRSLAPDHPKFQAYYSGELFLRDTAYHQGTVWAWLIGPFIDAWLKVYPSKNGLAHQLLEDFDKHLNEGCIGSISEIFDAEAPYKQRGCIAQAWSVAEVLRCWIKIG